MYLPRQRCRFGGGVYADGSIIEMASIGGGLYGYPSRLRCQDFLRPASRPDPERSKDVGGAFTRAMGRCRRSEVLYAYVQAFLEQVLVSVACNGRTASSSVARWLLMMRDRGDDDVLQITQNLLAKCWVSRGQPSRMLPELNVRFDCAGDSKSRYLIAGLAKHL